MIVGKSFYIIDGHWQIFRSYYAPFRDLTSPSGEPTRATYVFTTMLMKLITERKPDYLAVAMDSGREHLQRTRIYPEYKANRDKPPEDLPPQIERITQIIRAMGVPILQIEGAEADDIMATIVGRLAGADLRVVMVSRDKDLEQLIGPHAVLFDPMKDEIIDAARLEQVKGYPPVKAVEIQALCGDTSDNVPGVPGVGPKTAVKLIGQYGSAEAVVAHADELTPKLAQNIRTHTDTITLAKKLVTLTDDVDMDADLPKFTFQGLDTESLRPIFDELGFRRLIEQLKPADSAPHGTQSVGLASIGGQTTARDFDYRCVDTPKALNELTKELQGVTHLAVDTETTSVRPTWAGLVGISLAWREGPAVYIPVAGPLGAKVLDVEIVRKSLAGVFADKKI
ncbi:MAG: 5'-3' exonuclease H3TH domain-containing protein, partial [Planctomycetota bacterium]|nr:5'-3' exonuclease H3TH domain-containing protein [Planctomycetota bacterium]